MRTFIIVSLCIVATLLATKLLVDHDMASEAATNQAFVLAGPPPAGYSEADYARAEQVGTDAAMTLLKRDTEQLDAYEARVKAIKRQIAQ